MWIVENCEIYNKPSLFVAMFFLTDQIYEGQSKITEPYLIKFELSKMDIYLDDISLKLYVIYLIT